MPNIKSAIKRVKITKIKTLQNIVKKSALRTRLKKCKEAIANNDSKVIDLFNNTVKSIDKAASKKLIHKNTASRKKSKLRKALNKALKLGKALDKALLAK